MASEFELAGYGGHGSPAQAAALVGAPNYPNSIKWSEKNLIAVASGHLVTILSPASLTGPRGIVPISQSPLFDIGKVKREDFLSPELTEFRLAREGRACVRSLDWSPLGLASNGGCLLAVCTTQSLVKLYRAPFCDYTPEWVEVADLTELMYARFVENEFKEAEVASPVFAGEDGAGFSNVSLGVNPNKRRVLIQEPQHRKVQRTTKIDLEEQDRVDELADGDTIDAEAVNTLEGPLSPTNLFESLPGVNSNPFKVSFLVRIQGHSMKEVKEDLGMTNQGSTLQNQAERVVYDLVEVPLHCGNDEETPTLSLSNGNLRNVTPGLRTKKSRKAKSMPDVTDSPKSLKSDFDANAESSQNVLPTNYRARSYALSALVVAWSQKIHMEGRVFVLCAVGTKAGSVWLFRVDSPEIYSVEKTFSPHICILGEVPAHGAWVTSLSWGLSSSVGHTSGDTMVLATGADDGSVKLWSGNSQILALLPPDPGTVLFTLLRQVVDADDMLVSSLAITVTSGASSRMMLAVGKGSGQISTWEFDTSWSIIRMASQPRAHDQVVTGLTWTTNGHCLYSCGQDNLLQVWNFLGDQLSVLPLPTCSAILAPDIPQMSIDLPASVLDPYYGVALSPGNLSMAVVRGIAVDMIDQMYQARMVLLQQLNKLLLVPRTQKGVVHLFWVGGQKTENLRTSRHQGLGNPFAKSISSDDLANWSSRFLSTLHQMENHSQPLVLWDVLAALSSLKNVVGSDYVTSVVCSWLSTWCKGINPQTDDASFISFDNLKLATTMLDEGERDALRQSHKANLRDASTRQLQILCVLYRQLLLVHCKAELLSGRTSIERPDPVREKRREKADIPQRLTGEGLSSPAEEGVSKMHLHCVEHELRQRVFLGILYSTGSVDPTEKEKGSRQDLDLATVLIVDWVLANSTECLPELVQLAKHIRISLVAKRPLSGEQLLLESCTFCEAGVPLESLEVAHCRGVESKKGKLNHRLQRCSVSLQVCPGSPLWYCSCCARWASTLAPASFFSLSSRTYPEEVSTPLIQQPTQVACLFCGVLMQRYLPDFLLTSSAV